MTPEMEKLAETSDEDEEDLDMDVKEEDEDDGDDDDDDENNKSAYSRAVVIGGAGAGKEFGNNHGNRFQQQQHPQIGSADGDQQQERMTMIIGTGGGSGGGMRRCRPKEEKERTKLRERHRRAITARILSGLRRHGNYNLRVRADINEVIGALAREAGWTVLPDGTTFPARATNSQVRPMRSPPFSLPSPPLRLWKRKPYQLDPVELLWKLLPGWDVGWNDGLVALYHAFYRPPDPKSTVRWPKGAHCPGCVAYRPEEGPIEWTVGSSEEPLTDGPHDTMPRGYCHLLFRSL